MVGERCGEIHGGRGFTNNVLRAGAFAIAAIRFSQRLRPGAGTGFSSSGRRNGAPAGGIRGVLRSGAARGGSDSHTSGGVALGECWVEGSK